MVPSESSLLSNKDRYYDVRIINDKGSIVVKHSLVCERGGRIVYTKLYEKDGTPPRVEKHISQLKYRYPVLTRFLILVKEDEESSWYYDMYVPKGSILRIYSLS